jgi:hypothetical protein
MLKKFNEFINESVRPREGSSDSKSLDLTPEEVELFSSDGVLHRLIDEDKVSLYSDKVWYLKDDKETIAILDDYFDM